MDTVSAREITYEHYSYGHECSKDCPYWRPVKDRDLGLDIKRYLWLREQGLGWFIAAVLAGVESPEDFDAAVDRAISNEDENDRIADRAMREQDENNRRDQTG